MVYECNKKCAVTVIVNRKRIKRNKRKRKLCNLIELNLYNNIKTKYLHLVSSSRIYSPGSTFRAHTAVPEGGIRRL
jgi:hypothetical protein